MITPSSTADGGAVAVLGMGACSPLGYGVKPIQAAMAAGIRNFQDSRLFGTTEEPARTSRLPELDEAAPRADRISLLTRWALADFLASSPVSLPEATPVFVGLGSETPAEDLKNVRHALGESFGRAFDPATAALQSFTGGRVAFLSALAGAVQHCCPGRGEFAMILAVDTRCTRRAVDGLMRERRLLSDKDDGTIPGEAAIVVLVASRRSSAALQYAKLFVADPAFAEDDQETLRQSPQATDGLGRTFRALHEHPVAGAKRSTTVISFQTGELHFTRAFTTAYLRNGAFMPEPLRHELTATRLGDTGAAAAGMALVRADWMMNRAPRDQDQRVLIYGHDDDGHCAAAVAIRTLEAEG